MFYIIIHPITFLFKVGLLILSKILTIWKIDVEKWSTGRKITVWSFFVIISWLYLIIYNDTITILIQLKKFNGLILLYCLTYKSISRVSGAYDHKMQKGKVLDYWKSYARDNRLIAPESTNWVRSLAPRCRLSSSTWMQESWRVRLFVD